MSKRINSEQEWLPLAEQVGWSVNELANICGVSTRTLERHFKESMGKRANVWMAEQRLNQAMKFLEKGVSVKETASRVGYRHPQSFSREFKKMYGQCPCALMKPPLIRPLQSRNGA